MSADEAAFTCQLRQVASDTSVAMQHCQRTGQLSRYRCLSEARDLLYKAVHTPARDERQLTLDTQDDANTSGKA